MKGNIVKEYKAYYNVSTKEFASVLVSSLAHRHIESNNYWLPLVKKELQSLYENKRQVVRVYRETDIHFYTLKISEDGCEEREYPKTCWEVVEERPKHVLMKDNAGMWHLCIVNKWLDATPAVFVHVFNERGLRVTPNPSHNRRDWMDLRNANQSTIKLSEVANLTKFKVEVSRAGELAVCGFNGNAVATPIGFFDNWQLVMP